MSRASVITLSVLLVVAVVAAVLVGVINLVNKDDKKPSTTGKAVQEICQPTDYKDACFKSLAKVNTDDPKELVKTAFESAKAEISQVANKSKLLQELQNDPKTADAVTDCKELFQDAIDDLQRSFEEMNKFGMNDVNKVLENLKIWLSATITYQETCLDGFQNTTGDAGEKVRKLLQTSSEMSSNGLAIVTEMSTLLGTLDISSFNQRRLLEANSRYVVGHDGDDLPNRLTNAYRNRRLLSSAELHVVGHDDTDNNPLLEDDEQDKRRRRLLSFLDANVVGHDGYDLMPGWLDTPRRKLLQATNLAEDLKAKANVVVAQDGSGKYKTIEESIKDIPKYSNESFIIYIKEGVYNEYLVLLKWMTHVVFVGDGPTKTRITNNKNFVDGVKTFKTSTLSVLGDYFMAKDIGIENSAGAIKHQAVALRVQSDQSIFWNCHFDGYQDTLYTHTYRQFYRDCRVTGTIDFIFGDAAAFFQNCTFVVRKPLDNQRCIVTAQGRMERHQPTGIIIHKSRFEGDPDYMPVRQKNTAYLGRPWKEYSKTIIMESFIDESIAPDGWLPWEGTFGLETCYYGEYNNDGPGSSTANRVKWRGIKSIVPARAEKFMPPQLYESDDWIRASGIPYDPQLSTVAPGPGSGFDEDPNAPAGAPSIFPIYSSGSSASGTSGSSSSSSGSSSSSSGGSSSSSSGGSSSSSGSSSGTSSTGLSSSSRGHGGASGSSSTTPTSKGGSTGGSSSGSSSTTTSTGGSTGGSSSGSSTATPSTPTRASSTDASSSTTLGSETPASAPIAEALLADLMSPTPAPTEAPSPDLMSPTPTPTEASAVDQMSTAPTPSVDQLIAPSPTDENTPAAQASTSKSTSESPTSSTGKSESESSSSGTKFPLIAGLKAHKKLSTGPVTVRELERILMTNEELVEGDEQMNDDMSGNVPDGDEPSPAVAVPIPAPTPTITVSPISSPISSPSEAPAEELSDWLPPPGGAPAPEPEAEPADKVPPPVSPPKKNSAPSKSISSELYIIFCGIVLWVVLAT